MSDTSNLSINISARDTAAAQIRGLQGTIRDLEKEIRRASQTGLDTGGAYIGVLQKQSDTIKNQIAVLQGQATAIKQVTAAIVEQGDAAAVVHRTLSQGIDVSLGANYDRTIKSAAASAQTLATSLSAAAEADARFRESELATADAARIATDSIRAQGSAVRTLTGEQFFGVVQRKAGLGQQGLSAEASAGVFQREMGAVGGGLTLTPATGFSRLVSDLAGVKQSYLSAADSAAVFAASSEVAGETSAVSGGRLLQRESRHIVGLFDSLARGQRGQAISSLGAGARDAGLGVASLATSMVGLVAVMGGLAIMHHAEALGKWAAEMQAAAGATGMGLTEYTALAGALAQLGLSSDQADASMRRMARSLSTALSQPASLAAEAFHNLGISQEQLTANGQNVDGILHLLADAYAHTADGANKTANMEEILGRSFERLIPLLQNGGAGLDAMTAKQKELGNTLDEDGAQKLTQMGAAVHELGQSIRGEGITAMEDWSGVIITLSHGLEGLGWLISKVVNGLGALGSSILSVPTMGHDIYGSYGNAAMRKYMAEHGGGANPNVYTPPFTPAPGAAATVKAGDAGKAAVPALTPPVTPLEAMRLQMAQAGVAASHAGGSAQQARAAEQRAEITAMQHTLATAQLTAQQRVQVETELAQKQMELANEGRSGSVAAARQSYADFAAAERLKITSADGSMAKIVAVYDQWLTAAEGRYKQSAAVIEGIEKQKTQAINSARLRQIKEGATTEETVGRANAALAGAQADVARHQPGAHVSAAQSIGNLAAQAGQIQAQAQAEVAALVQVMNTAEQGSNTQRQAANEVLAVVSRAKQQEIALYDKAAAAAHEAAQKMTAPFKHMFDELGSQFTSLSDSLVKDLLAPKVDLIKQGLTTIKINEGGTQIHQILRKFALSLVTDATNTLETTLSKFAAKSLSGLLNIPLSTAGGGMSSLLAGGMDKIFGVGNQASSGIQTAQFGLATTQLQTAATTLQTAALTLQAGATATGAAGATGAGASGAAALTTALVPVTAAVTAGTVTQTAGQTTSTATLAATNTANNAALIAAITGQGAIQDALLTGIAVKPSLLGFSYDQGGVVPSAAGGMVVGGNGGQLSILHAQEMVLPAHLSRGIQGMIQQGGARGGNAAHLNYAPTINNNTRGGRGGTGMTRAEFAQTMAAHGGRMMGEARNMVRAGWRPG